VDHLHRWFEETRPDLKEALDERLGALWERVVIGPLMQLTEEHEPDQAAMPDDSNIIAFRTTVSA